MLKKSVEFPEQSLRFENKNDIYCISMTKFVLFLLYFFFFFFSFVLLFYKFAT